MNDKTEQLVRELAEKLGTTADHLWGVLVKQAGISSTVNTLALVLTGISLAAAWRWVTKAIKCGDDDSEETALLVGIFISVVSLVWFICLMSSVSDILSGFINPEYWALKYLTQ